MQNIIYALQDSLTGEIRYIGKSSKGLGRPKKHLLPCYYNSKRMFHYPIYRWIRKSTTLPNIIVIQKFDNHAHLNDAEKYWIDYFKYIGCNLLNCTVGGDGAVGNVWTEEQKKKLSQVRKGRVFSQSHKDTMSKNWHASRKDMDKSMFKSRVSAGTKLWWSNLSDEKRIRCTFHLKKSAGANKLKLVDQFGIVYNSMTEVAKKLQCGVSAVSLAVKGNRSCKGLILRKVS